MATYTPFENRIIAKAKRKQTKIAFIEYDDPRVIMALKQLHTQKIAHPVLVGDAQKILKVCAQHKLTVDVVDTRDPELIARYAEKLLKIRKKKGMTREKAFELLQDPIYVATFLVKEGKVHGLVSGATHPTAHTLRPAIQILGTKKGFNKISSHFIMVKQKQTYLFADCGVQIDPDANDLAEIATLSIHSAKSYGIRPKVAMLSFSTHGSAQHPFVTKVQRATRIAQKRNKGVQIGGEYQFDAAFVPEIRKKKAPDAKLKGVPTIFVFPDLQAGNICYKVAQRLSHFTAIGPIVQGLARPVNDLSRGCDVKEIVLATAITALQ